MPMRRNPLTGEMEDVGLEPGGRTDVGPSQPAQRGTLPGVGGATATGTKPTDVGGQQPNQRQTVGPAQRQARTAPAPWVGPKATTPPPAPPLPTMAGGPNFRQIAGSMPTAQMGPQYQTADKAWQGEALLPDLNSFAQSWMKDYNPLSSGYGATARQASESRLRKMEQDQEVGREDWAASRGLVGSSYEGDMKLEQDESIRRTALEEETAIMELIANMELMGRQSAGSFGLGVGEFGRGLGSDRRDEGRYGYEADRTRSRDFEDDSRYRTDTQLEAAGMEDDSILNRYLADLEAKRISETGIMDRAKLDMDRDDLGQRGWRDNASVQRDYDALNQDDEQFASDEAYRRDEFGENKRQYNGDSAFRDKELDAKTRAQEDTLLAEILDGGIGEITPETAAWLKEKFGIDLPVTKKEEDPNVAAQKTGEYTSNGVYKTRPSAPPKGKTNKDGKWDSTPQGWVWTTDRQDWWNPADWLD